MQGGSQDSEWIIRPRCEILGIKYYVSDIKEEEEVNNQGIKEASRNEGNKQEGNNEEAEEESNFVMVAAVSSGIRVLGGRYSGVALRQVIHGEHGDFWRMKVFSLYYRREGPLISTRQCCFASHLWAAAVTRKRVGVKLWMPLRYQVPD